MGSVYVVSMWLLACSLLTVVSSTALEKPVQDSPSNSSADSICCEKIVSLCCSKPTTTPSPPTTTPSPTTGTTSPPITTPSPTTRTTSPPITTQSPPIRTPNAPSYERCTIDLAAYGYDDSNPHGYVKTSGGSHAETYTPLQIDRYRGVTLFDLDPQKCTISNRRRYDTWLLPSDSLELVKSLERAKAGTIIIGVTADTAEGGRELQNTAGPFFASYHMSLSGLRLREKFAFIMQKGYPAKTIFERKPNFGESLRMRISVRVSTIQDVISFHKT